MLGTGRQQPGTRNAKAGTPSPSSYPVFLIFSLQTLSVDGHAHGTVLREQGQHSRAPMCPPCGPEKVGEKPVEGWQEVDLRSAPSYSWRQRAGAQGLFQGRA